MLQAYEYFIGFGDPPIACRDVDQVGGFHGILGGRVDSWYIARVHGDAEIGYDVFDC
jgi:hypothetical protein